MLIARLFPIESDRFKSIEVRFKKWDKFMQLDPIRWFGWWLLYVAGSSARVAVVDRTYFWDFSGWIQGSIAIVVISIVVGILSVKLKQKNSQLLEVNLAIPSLVTQLVLGIVIFMLGWQSFILPGILNGTPYFCAFLAMYFVHAIKMKTVDDTGENNGKYDDKKRFLIWLIAIFFLLTTVMIGFILDDPVASTGGIVALPFLIVAFLGRHIRHIRRAQFYPIFIFAVFLASREAWLVVPLLLLFYILRVYNYFSFKKVYPTFGVDYD
ncbi:MAG: hypothetical protein V3U16_07055 [Candidatus Neomarinimicrobiota bacterium]